MVTHCCRGLMFTVLALYISALEHARANNNYLTFCYDWNSYVAAIGDTYSWFSRPLGKLEEPASPSYFM